jgi:uncharacterized protein YqfB (UPF0267 family)
VVDLVVKNAVMDIVHIMITLDVVKDRHALQEVVQMFVLMHVVQGINNA